MKETVEDIVALLHAILWFGDFVELTGERSGHIRGKSCDELIAISVFRCERRLNKRCWDVKTEDLQGDTTVGSIRNASGG